MYPNLIRDYSRFLLGKYILAKILANLPKTSSNLLFKKIIS